MCPCPARSCLSSMCPSAIAVREGKTLREEGSSSDLGCPDTITSQNVLEGRAFRSHPVGGRPFLLMNDLTSHTKPRYIRGGGFSGGSRLPAPVAVLRVLTPPRSPT